MIKSDAHGLQTWLDDLVSWSRGSIHRLRLHRAFASADACLAGDSERLLHSYSRLGLWAHDVASAFCDGDISPEELSLHLAVIAQFGEFAFTTGGEQTGWVARFNAILHSELVPDFCSKPDRSFNPEGFAEASAKVTIKDARDFVRAWETGIMRHVGGGLYRAPRSSASEQFFWSGSKNGSPRPFTLWHEPVITVGVLARLHLDFGWPESCLGTQSSDWAFDVVAFQNESLLEHVAGEVKKSVAEVNALIEYMKFYGARPEEPEPLSGKARNAFKKVEALRARQAPVFWAIGPGGYDSVFRVDYGSSGKVTMRETDPSALEYSWSGDGI